MIHSKSSVTDQLVFAADVTLTLNLVKPLLIERENQATLNFIEKTSGDAKRSNMKKLSEHTYCVGQSKLVSLSSSECAIVGQETAEVFGKAFCNGVLYYSRNQSKEQHKRDSTICIYKNGMDQKFGEIQKFVIAPIPFAIIHEFEPFESTLLDQAGHTCRSVLKDYAEVDLLNDYIHAVNINPQKVNTIPIENLKGKAILIMPPEINCVFAIKQPNNFERH